MGRRAHHQSHLDNAAGSRSPKASELFRAIASRPSPPAAPAADRVPWTAPRLSGDDAIARIQLQDAFHLTRDHAVWPQCRPTRTSVFYLGPWSQLNFHPIFKTQRERADTQHERFHGSK